jgi:hypothetical protein
MTAESRIICDSPAGAIPALLLELLFGCPPVLWDVFSLASDDVWSELHEVHRALLGDVRHLDALREVLADSDDRNAMVHGDAHRSNEQLNRYRDIQGRVMAGLPRADFAAFMTRVISLEPRATPITVTTLLVGFRVHQRDPTEFLSAMRALVAPEILGEAIASSRRSHPDDPL